MAYRNKVKFHGDIPVYVKELLIEAAEKEKQTSTNLLSTWIREEHACAKKQREESLNPSKHAEWRALFV